LQGSHILLTLRIENETTLPDGGPLSISVEGTRGIDIGRDQHLDWTLPDPNRFISGKHCEIRWQDGFFWLHDVSTNGTFLYGADGRLKAPHKLRDGDRFLVGHYIIVATVSGQPREATSEISNSAPPRYDDLWTPVDEAAPPIDARQLKASRDLQPVKPDFLDWAVDLQPPPGSPSRPLSPFDWKDEPRLDDADWARGSPKPLPPQPAPAAEIPNPRRPVWVTGEPAGAWAGSAPSVQPTSPLPSAGTPQSRDISPGNDAASDSNLVRLIARSAGLPDDIFAARNPAQLAEEIGQLLRLLTENMKQLLEARQQAKRLARSSNQTTVQAFDNNPLKFAPTVDEAMRIMFGPPTKSYLDATSAVAQGFDDLKAHQIKTFSAMQHALKRLLDDLAPEEIERESTASRRFLALGSAKTASWDTFTTRWKARTRGQEDGMLNTFMQYFAEYYDRDGNAL
jgi:type VI secretion system protein ImpI